MPTAREAIQSLVALGMVRTQHGVGTFVTRRRDERRLLSVSLRRASTAELSALCALLDRQAATRAARRFAGRRPPAPGVASLLLFLGRERSSARHSWPEIFTDRDFELHDAVMGAAGRDGYLAGRLRGRLGRRLRPVLIRRAASLADDDDLDQQHRDLAAAIVAGDEGRTRRLAADVAEAESAALG